LNIIEKEQYNMKYTKFSILFKATVSFEDLSLISYFKFM